MPIYEFLCRGCNKIFSFHSFKVDTTKVPSCPKCGADDLQRRPSSFGITTGMNSPAGQGEGAPNLEDPRMEAEMMRFAAEMEHLDENDPKAMAGAVRKMTELAGEPVTPAMEEMIRRLEAGEDPDRIEEDLGDALEGEMGDEGGGAFGGAPPTQDGGLYPM